MESDIRKLKKHYDKELVSFRSSLARIKKQLNKSKSDEQKIYGLTMSIAQIKLMIKELDKILNKEY